ncbi:MAG: DUF1499 domain-containing protein [Pseudomonadota bacterium]
MLLWIGLGMVVAFAAYVRLAPSDTARWHVTVEAGEDKTGGGSAVRVLKDVDGALARVDSAMMAEPATTRLAGSVSEGHITYISRSRWWGFPDYTTVQVVKGQIRMFARLRFGQQDLGVNAARLERVKRAVQAGG